MRNNKKFIIFLLFFSLLAFSGDLSAKKHKYGAKLEIQKRDGQLVYGELIAVKKDSLLLLGYESSIDFSVYLRDISQIKILKKFRIGKGVGSGFMIGAFSGAAYALTSTDEDQFAWAMVSAGFFGFVGATVGVLGDVFAAAPVTIHIEGASEQEVEKNLKKLRSKSRFPDYR